ncbi:MAG: hypothetical protein DRP01_05025 [Archaeoglobales archaeon]|nr:MAG: hypothetical protein DRP09_14745 [Candidatus Thorarchaeota archaeon]RLI86023.1 MAG: hypothetical protein DRP01_05025 [Archaeoglobales archaeon]
MPVYLGETCRLRHKFYDFEGNVVTPSTHQIEVYDPDGTKIAESTEPTWDAENELFVYVFTIPENGKDGTYTAIWKAKDTAAGYSWIEKIEFAVQSLT